MKESSEKSSSTTSATTHQSTSQPFFVKAGGGGFFAPDATAAPEIAIHVNTTLPLLAHLVFVDQDQTRSRVRSDVLLEHAGDLVVQMTDGAP